MSLLLLHENKPNDNKGMSLLLLHENKPNDNKGISKHLRFCWQQLFGLLPNITISLKSTRPTKTEIKIIVEKF